LPSRSRQPFSSKAKKELQVRRQRSGLFQGRHSFVTARDLLKWAARQPNSKLEAAQHGYFLVAERLRRDDEKLEVQQVLEQVFQVKLNVGELYSQPPAPLWDSVDGIAMTASMKRLVTLVSACLAHSEPVLLVGETGCGKTTVFQLLADVHRKPLRILNCHQNTEAADLLGSLRPVRGRSSLQERLAEIKRTLQDLAGEWRAGAELDQGLGAVAMCCALCELLDGADRKRQRAESCEHSAERVKRSKHSPRGASSDGDDDEADADAMDDVDEEASESEQTAEPADGSPEGGDDAKRQHADSVRTRVLELKHEAEGIEAKLQALFEWHDGPLIHAMKDGSYFLLGAFMWDCVMAQPRYDANAFGCDRRNQFGGRRSARTIELCPGDWPFADARGASRRFVLLREQRTFWTVAASVEVF
jgi:energy-coupling factor transporter ATP-binding protein EcfA2